MQVSFRKLETLDLQGLKELRELYKNVFGESMPEVSDEYLTGLLHSEQVVFFVAEKDHEVVGGVTAYRFPSLYGQGHEMYIYDMAVATTLQRQGIGSGLLDFIKNFCRSEGAKHLYVQADAVDTGARNFYLKNGGTEEDVRHYDFEL
jgi:GNAT superfamily N-acetyltransferase